MNNIKVIGLGALNIDHSYLTIRTHDNDEAVVKEAGSFPGGSAANTIYGLARQGLPALTDLTQRYRELYNESP